ncbi:TatD family hydrolase [Bacteroidia bacterium]|nr:TatD family hydrolase [Bacteroidia bacterium]
MIDTHSHIYSEEFDEDIAEVISRAKTVGVEKIVLPNIDSKSIDRMLRVEALYPHFCHAAMGLHPTSVNENYLIELKTVENQLNSRNFVAIGEIGIDLYWDKTFEREQIITFQTQCEWALQRELPVIIHLRNSFTEIMNALKPFKNKGLRGIFHSFSGTAAEASEILNFGDFYLGINGIVTFKNSNLSATLKEIPLQHIVTETDAPYLTPAPHRGTRNETSYIALVVKKLAEIYQLTEAEIDCITTENAKKLFKILS